jgi:hypothetical protein
MIRRNSRLWTGMVLLLLAVVYLWLVQRQASELTAEGDVERLFSDRQSGVMVEFSGSVVRVLADDREGSRHQRFIVELDSGHTVLVSHNIDLAPRVKAMAPGDVLDVRGQYEWNERGGVVHWTHHDPDGRRQGGWIKRAGETYR